MSNLNSWKANFVIICVKRSSDFWNVRWIWKFEQRSSVLLFLLKYFQCTQLLGGENALRASLVLPLLRIISTDKFFVNSTKKKLCSCKKLRILIDIGIDIIDWQFLTWNVKVKVNDVSNFVEKYKPWVIQPILKKTFCFATFIFSAIFQQCAHINEKNAQNSLLLLGAILAARDAIFNKHSDLLFFR